MNNDVNPKRTKIFISKATPADDAFTLWIAPKLEAHGYEVFADILCLKPGDGWRLKLTNTLQNEAVKMLLCCSDETLQRAGVIEEIEIAKDLTNSIPDQNFIIPLKIKKYKKVFGIGSLQYIDFEKSWADGLSNLLSYLDEEEVPKKNVPKIQPEWAAYQKRKSVELDHSPETLTSNWLRVTGVPDTVNYVAPKGSIPDSVKSNIAKEAEFPLVQYLEGYLTFAGSHDFEQQFPSLGEFIVKATTPYFEFIDDGEEQIGLEAMEAKKVLSNLFRQAWEMHLRKLKLIETKFSEATAFIAGENQVGIKKRISWGKQGQRRNSMLRGIAKKKVWEYGISAQPSFFPFPHFRLKARVLFSEANGIKKGNAIDNAKVQHRLRRSICTGWRNRAWHGRLMALLEILAGDSPYISLPVGVDRSILIDAMPIQATAPVTARQTNKLGEDGEEVDFSTLQGYFEEDEE